MEKVLSRIFKMLALFMSHLGCVFVTYTYMKLLCGGLHMGWSAPADIAFIYIIPFVLLSMLCWLLSCWWNHTGKSKSKNLNTDCNDLRMKNKDKT